jgi:VCBS repeat protein/Big-like domain-containing protein
MRTRLFFCFLLISLPAFAQLAAVGDLNGDGKPDVVITDGGTEGQIGVFLNTGNGALGTGTFLNVGSAATAVWLADFNGDGHLDILAVTSPKLQILFGDGKGGFGAPVAIPQSSIPAGGPSVVADFNGDGFPDIAFAFGSPNPTLAVLFGDGHGGFTLSPPHLIAIESGVNTAASALFVVDANNDGRPDLVINTSGAVNSGVAKSFLAINDGNGGFVTSQLSPDTAMQAIGDFNSDGNIDFFILSRTGDQTVLFGDGQGGILYSPSHRTCFNQPNSAQFGVDFDHNGTTDLVGFFGVTPGNGHGGFGGPFSLSPDPINPIAVADFNADGRPDLVLLTSTRPPVASILLNNVATPVSISASTNISNIASVFNTNVGQQITLTAFINSSCGVPTGSVTFTDGATTLGSAPVNIYGVASLDTTFTTGGTHNIGAAFTGNLDPVTNTIYNNATASVFSVTANNAPPTGPAPTVVLTVSANPARELNPVTLTASFTSPNPPTTGLLTFRADGQVLGVVPLFSPQIQIPFPPGLHNLQVTFGGDGNIPAATSTTLVEDVRALNAVRSPSSVQLTVTPPSAGSTSQSVTLAATLNGVANPQANFIYRFDGAFIASAPSTQPVKFLPPLLGTFTVSAEYTGDAVLAPSTATATLVVGNPNGDFNIAASPSSATIKAGQTATFTITISPVNGMNSPVTFACSGLPAASSCTFSPATVTPNGSPASTTLTISTTAAGSAVPFAGLRPWTFVSWSLATVLGLLMLRTAALGKNARRCSVVFGCVALLLCLVSCGGGSPQTNPKTGTPSGTSSITVTATSGASHSAPLNITVTP